MWVLYGMDYVSAERAEQHAYLRAALLDHLKQVIWGTAASANECDSTLLAADCTQLKRLTTAITVSNITSYRYRTVFSSRWNM